MDPSKEAAELQKTFDEDKGGVNLIVHPQDGAASANSMTTHSSSAPTPADMGIS
jgi:hypothetical protein